MVGRKTFEEHDRQGILPGQQIASLHGMADRNLQARAVVFGACTSGAGTATGEGLVGFARTLILAGVPSVVLSGWKVEDAATYVLMPLQEPTREADAARARLATGHVDNAGLRVHRTRDNRRRVGSSNAAKPSYGLTPKKFKVWQWAFQVVGDPETRFPFSYSQLTGITLHNCGEIVIC